MREGWCKERGGDAEEKKREHVVRPGSKIRKRVLSMNEHCVAQQTCVPQLRINILYGCHASESQSIPAVAAWHFLLPSLLPHSLVAIVEVEDSIADL